MPTIRSISNAKDLKISVCSKGCNLVGSNMGSGHAIFMI